ncbi:MAG: PKD domain-containing protein [Trueperaceae bacterium]|nr:PKD domain-containing protein [Trueperaceae bacterium]
MRRIVLVSTLLLALVACQVSVVRVTITEPDTDIALAAGATQTFKATVTGGDTASISWSDASAGGSFVPEAGPEVVYTAPLVAGSFEVTASLGGAKDNVKVTVLPQVALSITEPTGPVSLSVGEKQAFKASASNADSVDISWSDGSAGGSFSPATGAEVTYTPPLAAGVYTVTASVSSANGTASASEQVTVLDPLPADETLTITGDGDPNSPIKTEVTLAGGASRVFQIDVPSGSKEALVVELNQPLQLGLYKNDGFKSLFATSSSADFFAAGESGLSKSLESQSISILVTCRGSCVYQSAVGVTRAFAKVTNQNASQVTFNLFAYVDDFGDKDEPENDAAANAFAIDSSNSGALETINDVDFYRVTTAGLLKLTAAQTVVSPRAQILDASNNLIATLEPEGTQAVEVGMIVKVFSGNSRAAASSVSQYFLTVE